MIICTYETLTNGVVTVHTKVFDDKNEFKKWFDEHSKPLAIKKLWEI